MTNENFKPGALGTDINKALGKAIENHGKNSGNADYIRMGKEVQNQPNLYASLSSVSGLSDMSASEAGWMLFELVVNQMVDQVWKEKMVGNDFEEATELDAGAGYSVVVPQNNNVGTYTPYNYATFTGQTNQLITGPSVVAPTENNVVYKMSLFDNFFNPTTGQKYTLPWLSFAEAMPLDKVVKLISVSPAKLTEIYNTIFNRAKTVREIIFNNWDKYKFTIFAPRNTYTTTSTNVQDFITNFLVPVVGDMTFANANYNGGSNWYQFMSNQGFQTGCIYAIQYYDVDPSTGNLTQMYKIIGSPLGTGDSYYTDWLNFYNEFFEATSYYNTTNNGSTITLTTPNTPFNGNLSIQQITNGVWNTSSEQWTINDENVTLPMSVALDYASVNNYSFQEVFNLNASDLYENTWYSALPSYSQNNASPSINTGRLLPVPFLENSDPYDDLVIYMNYKTMAKILAWYTTNAIGDNRFEVDTQNGKPYITKIIGVPVRVAGQIYPLPQYVQQGAPQHNSVIKREALPDGYIAIMSNSYIEWHKYIDETYATGILPASLVNQYITTMAYMPIVKPWRKGLLVNAQSIFTSNSSALNVNIVSEPSTNQNTGIKQVELYSTNSNYEVVPVSPTNPIPVTNTSSSGSSGSNS